MFKSDSDIIDYIDYANWHMIDEVTKIIDFCLIKNKEIESFISIDRLNKKVFFTQKNKKREVLVSDFNSVNQHRRVQVYDNFFM